MNEYPKFLYSASGSCKVQSRVQEDALEVGMWFDSPENVCVVEKQQEVPTPVVPDEVEMLAGSQDEIEVPAPKEPIQDRPKLGRPFKNK